MASGTSTEDSGIKRRLLSAKADEVRNARHGSPRRPQTHKELAEDAPLNRLLDQLRTIRADLRFREDGVHTVLTVDRQPKEK